VSDATQWHWLQMWIVPASYGVSVEMVSRRLFINYLNLLAYVDFFFEDFYKRYRSGVLPVK
jgi:hypothetical protein